jgi:hypothetical protein
MLGVSLGYMIGPEHDSLGQAIHDLKPAADAKSAAKTAEHEAHADIAATRPMLSDRITANAALLAKVTPLLPSHPTGCGQGLPKKASSSPRFTQRRI